MTNKVYKGFILKPDEKSPNTLRVVTAGKGGKIPNELSGMYTSSEVAMIAIDHYVAKPKRGEKNAGKARKDDGVQ